MTLGHGELGERLALRTGRFPPELQVNTAPRFPILEFVRVAGLFANTPRVSSQPTLCGKVFLRGTNVPKVPRGALQLSYDTSDAPRAQVAHVWALKYEESCSLPHGIDLVKSQCRWLYQVRAHRWPRVATEPELWWPQVGSREERGRKKIPPGHGSFCCASETRLRCLA